MPDASSPYSDAPIEFIPTADGGTVGVKRRPRGGGPPVLFIHGLAVNADLWDLPDVEGPDFRYRSLARCLHDAGFDIWLMNLRGHGKPHMYSAPPPTQRDWCVDHFILYDLPAVFEHINRVTGRRPFAIGASMGAMSLAGYLQGAIDTGGNHAVRIAVDAATARRRQAQLAGAIFAEFPARLVWPESLYDERERIRWQHLVRNWRRIDGELNFPFELVARTRIIPWVVATIGFVPSSWVKGNSEVKPWYRHLPGRLSHAAASAELQAMKLMIQIAACFTGATNHRAEVLLRGRRYVIDDMKAGVLRQMAKSIRRRAFVSFISEPEHVYSDHYRTIGLPTLVVQGVRDRIANHQVVQRDFFDVISADDKTMLLDPDIAHGEIEAAPASYERLYPQIARWIRERVPASDTCLAP